jgi:hypothetical protein
MKAAAKKTDAKVKCHAKTNLAAAPDPTCLQKAEETFTKAFTKAEKPGACTRTGDAARVESMVDTFVAALVQALQPPASRATATPAQKCAVTKLKAASKKAVAKTTCQTKNLASPNVGLLAICYGSAEGKFDTAFANAEKPGACTVSGDAAAIEAMVDAFVSAIAAGPPTPTPTRTPTLLPGQATPTPVPCTGFRDNGNGTITDCSTKLMWEKKDQSSDGLHDVDYTWPWAGTCSIGGKLCQPSVSASNLCFAQAGGAVASCAVCGPAEGYAAATRSGAGWKF